jgi:epoxyqueuosine reductase
MDATKCIAYLTIKLKGEIPEAMHTAIGQHLYGCDVCQEVCPWNEKFALPLREDTFRARPAVADKEAVTLARDLLAMSAD